MGYSVRKAGEAFSFELETNKDLTGQAAGFSSYYLNTATGVKTDIAGSFAEDVNTDGLYHSPSLTIPDAGRYSVVVNNPLIGMDNNVAPFIVVNATIDDIKIAVDSLTTTMNTVAADVDGLDGQNLDDIKLTLASIKTLIDDEDGTAVNSVMEFVTAINTAIESGSSGLAALAGYTDDVENMLLGTEFLADGVTANPLFGADNATIKGIVETNLLTLQGDLNTLQTAVELKITEAKDAVLFDVAAVKTIVESNEAKLANAGYGLEALKALLDSLTTSVTNGNADILAVLEDGTKGLVGIYDTMVARFDAVDASLSSIEGKVDTIGGAQSFNIMI